MSENNVFQLRKRNNVIIEIARDATRCKTVAVVEQNIIGRFLIDLFLRPTSYDGRKQQFVRISVTRRIYPIGRRIRSRREKARFVFDADLTVPVQTDDLSFADIHARMFQQNAQITF